MEDPGPCPECPEGECECIRLTCGMESVGIYVITTSDSDKVVLRIRRVTRGLIFVLQRASRDDESADECDVYVTSNCDSTVFESRETASSRHVIHFTCTCPSASEFYMDKIGNAAAFAFSPDPDTNWSEIFLEEDAEWPEGTPVTTVGVGLQGSGIRGQIAGKVDHIVGRVDVDLHGARGRRFPVYILLEHIRKNDICEFEFQFKRDGAKIDLKVAVDYTSFEILNINDEGLVKELVRAAHIGMHVNSVTDLVKPSFALHAPCVQ